MAKNAERQIQVKEQFFKERGKWKWNDTWETILDFNPEILAAYSGMSSVPHRKGGISPKIKELIYVAIDNAITHYYTPGFLSHLRHGMCDLGATPEELIEVFAICSTLGTSTYLVGIPILCEELQKRGWERGELTTESQKALKKRFVDKYGYWNAVMQDILLMDEEMLAGYMDYIEAAGSGKALDDKTRELIYIAINASPTALNQEALRIHIQKALELGIPGDDIVEVFEMAACLGIHSVMIGIPAMKKNLTEREGC